MKRNAVIILMLAAVLTLGGCGKSEQKAPEEETKTEEPAKEETASGEASEEDVLAYIKDTDENTVLVDARVADAYQGWALDGAEKGGHFENAVNISAQWIDCEYESNEKENKTREESIQKELDANKMTAEKSYIVYDTNGKDAAAVKGYLEGLGYKNVSTFNASELINSGSENLVSYENYNLYMPADIVKNISDHVVKGTELEAQAADIVKDAKVALLDVSWGDETNNEETGSGYEGGHVPGSVHVNTDEYETPKVYVEEKDEDFRSEWRLIPDKELIALAEAKGVTKDSCVVIVGYEPLATTRMAVILKYLGCENVHVMSEGLVGWNAKGYEMETGINKPEKVSFGADKPQNPDMIDTIDEAADKLKNDSDFQLIDTRTIEEWEGKDTGYGYHDLAGRIDGTILSESGVGYSSSMYNYRNPDKSMRSKEILEAMWKDQGIDTAKHMSFFCGSGWRAAEEVWDAMVIGYEDVSLYSDGWIGWSNEGHPYIDKDGNTVHYDKEQNKVVPVK
ncbi:MAG: thiosulfate sulfurtransferase [Dorea sp.]|nr:thiosulfate sulfurtransferase [Dorea sp.]